MYDFTASIWKHFDRTIFTAPGLARIIFLALGNFALLFLHVWIPRGRKLDLPTITPSESAQDRWMCAACDVGWRGFRGALRRSASRNAGETTTTKTTTNDMGRVPDGEPLCTCSRFYLVTRTSPSGVRYCVARALTVKIRTPIICRSAAFAYRHSGIRKPLLGGIAQRPKYVQGRFETFVVLDI